MADLQGGQVRILLLCPVVFLFWFAFGMLLHHLGCAAGVSADRFRLESVPFITVPGGERIRSHASFNVFGEDEIRRVRLVFQTVTVDQLLKLSDKRHRIALSKVILPHYPTIQAQKAIQ